jgi:hypothetical protein
LYPRHSPGTSDLLCARSSPGALRQADCAAAVNPSRAGLCHRTLDRTHQHRLENPQLGQHRPLHASCPSPLLPPVRERESLVQCIHRIRRPRR